MVAWRTGAGKEGPLIHSIEHREAEGVGLESAVGFGSQQVLMTVGMHFQ